MQSLHGLNSQAQEASNLLHMLEIAKGFNQYDSFLLGQVSQSDSYCAPAKDTASYSASQFTRPASPRNPTQEVFEEELTFASNMADCSLNETSYVLNEQTSIFQLGDSRQQSCVSTNQEDSCFEVSK